MRRATRHNIWLVAVVVSLLALGAGSKDTKEVDDGMDVYFRSTDLMALSDQDLPKYPDTDPGESKLLAQDFPDAPPQIPHGVEDMYPITGTDNECLTCHAPENAIEKEDIPLPESHFEQPVMGKGAASDPQIWVVKDYKVIKEVVGARYNCSMCHTPQATNVPTPKSKFVPPRVSAAEKK